GSQRHADGLRTSAGGAHGVGERVDVVGAVMMAAVDKEGGGSRDAARIGAGDVLCDALGMLSRAQFAPEALDVEPDLGGDAPQLLRGERPLAGVHGGVHLPEVSLR